MKKQPQLFGWIAGALTIVVMALAVFHGSGELAGLRKIGAGVLIVAGVFIFLPFMTLRRHGKPLEGKSYMHTTVVVDRGVYAIVRHPQYLGYIMLNLGFMFLLQSPLALSLGVLAIVFFFAHTIQEDRYCAARFGENWRGYSRKTPGLNFPLGIVRLVRKRSKRSV